MRCEILMPLTQLTLGQAIWATDEVKRYGHAAVKQLLIKK